MVYRFNPFTDKLDLVDTASSMGAILTLTGDSGGAVGPDGSGNINTIATAPLTITGNPGSSTTTISDNRVIVKAFRSTTIANATGDGSVVAPIIFDTITNNQGSAYNATTGIFTAPRSKSYAVCVNVSYDNLLVGHNSGSLTFVINGGTGAVQSVFNPGLNASSPTVGYTNVYTETLSGIVDLIATQTLEIWTGIFGSTKTVGIFASGFTQTTSLSIYEIG